MVQRILSYEQAEIIRKWRKQDPKKYTFKALMTIFHISRSTLKEILKGKSYNALNYKGHTKVGTALRNSIIALVNVYALNSRRRGQIIRLIAKANNISSTIVRRIAADALKEREVTKNC